jgi:hypothetical protein
MKILACLPLVALASCATIVSKTSYPVNITSNPSGCRVVVKKADGSVVHQGTTPATVTLSSRGGYFKPAKYTLEFSKPGLPSQNLALTAEMNGWYMGNILIGGLVGMLVVDPASGAMWSLPDNVNANLTPLASVSDGNGKTVAIVDRNVVPADIQSRLVALN